MRIGVMLAALALAACGGDRVKLEGEASGQVPGGPPRVNDTTVVPIDSNPSLATDTIPLPTDSTPVVHIVNNGTHGMAAIVRWALSPDQRAIIAVEDAVGVEAEAVPDGFLYASEATGGIVQVDGVWDVAPSPDWSRLAFGRAFVFRSGETDSIPTAEWQRFFGWLPEDVAERSTAAMRRRAMGYVFDASGMSYAKAIGLTQVLKVDSLAPGRAVVQAPSLRLEGWRVKWTPSGDTLAVGGAPRAVQDDAPPSRWTLVRPATSQSYRDSIGVAPANIRLANVNWITGPTIDISVPFDMARARRVPALGATVTSADGTISTERRGATTTVGPGAALATTRDGRFILALRPRENAREYDPKVELVVYELAP